MLIEIYDIPICLPNMKVLKNNSNSFSKSELLGKIFITALFMTGKLEEKKCSAKVEKLNTSWW